MKTRQIVARAAGVIVAVGALLGAGNVAQANEQSGDHGVQSAGPRDRRCLGTDCDCPGLPDPGAALQFSVDGHRIFAGEAW